MKRGVIIISGVSLAVLLIIIGIVGYCRGWFTGKKNTGAARENAPVNAIGIGIMPQQEADDLAGRINQIIKDSNAQFGGMTAQTDRDKNVLVQQLIKGGYQVINGKAIRK